MEQARLIKVLEEVKGKQLQITSLTTDRHCQIKKYMREEEEDINHQFDVWHFCKSIKVRLLNAAKKKACEELKPWIKSICNHFWWSCATCEGDEILLKEKWISIVFHIQNRHWWTGNSLYHQCSHSELFNVDERCKKWLSPKSQAFDALQSMSLIKQF